VLETREETFPVNVEVVPVCDTAIELVGGFVRP
jgi:hypothetical protein